MGKELVREKTTDAMKIILGLVTCFKSWYWVFSPFSGFVTDVIPEIATKRRRK